MRFSAIFTLGLAGTALATPLVERAGSSPTDIISGISDKTDALDSAIKAYSGGDPSKVESASADLIKTITSGTDAIKSGDDISSTDALALPGPVQALTKKVEQAIDDIIAKKDKFVEAGAGGKVKDSLNQQKSAADGLASAITSKVPESLKEIAQSLSAGISTAIQKGVDAYKDVSDSAPSSSAGSSESATATGSASETGSASTTGSASVTSSSVIPTSSGAASSSAAPSGSSTPTGSGSASATSPPLATGAANKATIGYSLGAVAMAAIAVAV
ncbi:hydrophobic surface binding protein A-domain-containing protein [Aspergillus minisclerotigenes]|uniref:Cell wall mannoprotein 1 n=1 Tax=Aspergillus minisclerotigenes TaxID=656917 RepID=A0A5N6ITA1_9EURO|nr:hydrophobic surface binding protein A-domain-containing protein [Aspergillus minisclerotigenes]